MEVDEAFHWGTNTVALAEVQVELEANRNSSMVGRGLQPHM